MSNLLISHDYDDGTMVTGTEKNSSAHHVLKKHPSWVWARSVGAWLLRSSRQRLPKRAKIDDMAQQLRAAGYRVEITVEDTMPDMEHREADVQQRSEERATALEEKAQRQQRQAAEKQEKADGVFSRIPTGQPILVGHHSETRDRNTRERAWNNLGKAREMRTQASDTAQRAQAAASNVGARYNPETVGNRIDKWAAEERRLLAELDGTKEHYHTDPDTGQTVFGGRPATGQRRERLLTNLDEARAQLQWWREVRSEQIDAGKALDIGPDTVSKGDWVAVRGRWCRVRRVNNKSVSVPNPIFPSVENRKEEATQTVPWHKISEHCITKDMPEKYVERYEEVGTRRIGLGPPETYR